MSLHFVFVCGGTGGHIYPAMAIAESLSKLGVKKISFAGREASMEEKLVAEHYDFNKIQAVPLKRSSFWANLTLPFKLSAAIMRSIKVLKSTQPNAVVATGGYVSLPIVLAAAWLKIPIYLQEQNAVAGVANKIGAKFAHKIFVTSETAAKQFKNKSSVIMGNPVRALSAAQNSPAPVEFASADHKVLILGGSQGAKGINEKITASLKQIAGLKKCAVVWQAGLNNVESISSNNSIPDNVHVKGFLDDVYAYIQHADVVISRAGASTLAELLAFGKASILVPFPFATANHQEHNARVLEKAGAAWVELDNAPNELWTKVMKLLGNPAKLEDMQQKAKQMGMPDAADRIAENVLADFPEFKGGAQ